MTGKSLQPELTTERLRLRRPRADDADRLTELAGDLAVSRMLTRVPHPYSRADADSFLAFVATPRPDGAEFLIEDSEGMVGMMGFHTEPETLGPEFGYWIGRPYWGHGYATEAASAALRWADGEWRRKLVVSGHFADNPASARVLVKTGFLYTGVVEHKFCKARGEPAATRMMLRLA